MPSGLTLPHAPSSPLFPTRTLVARWTSTPADAGEVPVRFRPGVSRRMPRIRTTWIIHPRVSGSNPDRHAVRGGSSVVRAGRPRSPRRREALLETIGSRAAPLPSARATRAPVRGTVREHSLDTGGECAGAPHPLRTPRRPFLLVAVRSGSGGGCNPPYGEFDSHLPLRCANGGADGVDPVLVILRV